MLSIFIVSLRAKCLFRDLRELLDRPVNTAFCIACRLKATFRHQVGWIEVEVSFARERFDNRSKKMKTGSRAKYGEILLVMVNPADSTIEILVNVA